MTVEDVQRKIWQELIEEFRLGLSRLGNRASPAVGSNIKVTSGWTKPAVDRREISSWLESHGSRPGLESLRTYLKENAPKSYSFLGR